MSWSAQQLLERFDVHGRFYERQFEGKNYVLRSHLEIFDRSLSWSTVRERSADLVAVMMNPGASRPLADLDPQGWAPAVPDRTQYQLMKLALSTSASEAPIRHVRVINLSDLRTPKSAELFKTLAVLNSDWHSLFDSARRAELRCALGDSATPVLLAWGLSPHLKPLARTALDTLKQRTLLGLTENGWSYRHPLPQRADLQSAWLARMTAQLTERG